jgi:hypothetical protein
MKMKLLAVVALLWFASSAHAVHNHFLGTLDGLQERPPGGPVVTPGTGFGTAEYDAVANTLTVHVEFSGLVGTTTDAHIHCCFVPGTPVPPGENAGVALGFSATFPLGVTSGTYDQVFNLSNPAVFNTTFRNNNGGTADSARDALLAAMRVEPGEPANSPRAYFNIHTTFRPGGEIRGDISSVPEPASMLLAVCGLAMFALRRRVR